MILRLRGWYEWYAKDGFTIVGVHSPEFDCEKPCDKVVDAMKKMGRTTRSCRTTRCRSVGRSCLANERFSSRDSIVRPTSCITVLLALAGACSLVWAI